MSKSKAFTPRSIFPAFSDSAETTLAAPLSLSDVVSLTPAEMARRSSLVTAAYRELVNMALSLKNPQYRRLMTDVLNRTAMTFMGTPET